MNDHPISPQLIAQLVDLSRRAGAAIMAIYNNRDSYNIEQKGDDSPLTAADLAAHRLISAELPGLLPLPMISEEGDIPEFADRHLWENYWLIDPLDGTKEFIAGNGQFTVNIALIQRGRPLLGVVHVPATDITYLGVLDARVSDSIGAFKYLQGVNPERIMVRSLLERFAQKQSLTVLLCHRHGTQANVDLMAILARNWPGEIETTNAGSSLKFCVLAEGKADFYPRLGPTSEWDTAAAHAVVTAAGGQVLTLDGKPLRYNLKDSVLNPEFLVVADDSHDYVGVFSGYRT